MENCPIEKSIAGRIGLVCLSLVILATSASVSVAQRPGDLDYFSTERLMKMREVERYQFNIADKFYRARNWEVAGAEFEKYLKLYERSDAASHCQLKWSLCQVQLQKLNTAIKDGFQSVIDYWPESPDATAAAYFIATTYRGLGDVKKAKRAYRDAITKHAGQLVAVLSINDLIAIARSEMDDKTEVSLLRNLTYDVDRKGSSQIAGVCSNASTTLASIYFNNASFLEGVKALETTYPEKTHLGDLVGQVASRSGTGVSSLIGKDTTKSKGDRLANETISFIKEKMPAQTDDTLKAQALSFWYLVLDITNRAQRFDEIPKLYEQIGKSFGFTDDLWGRLAGWYLGRQKYADARATYRKFENEINGLGGVARVYRDYEKKYDEAVKVFNELLAKDDEHKVQWLNEIALTYRYAGKYPLVIETYRTLLVEDSKNSGNYQLYIGDAHRDAGQFPEAIAQFRNSSSFPANLWRIAYVYRHNIKEYSKARDTYGQIAASFEGDAPHALFEVAEMSRQLKQNDSAIKQYQLVCKRFPKSSFGSRAHNRLENDYGIVVKLGGTTGGK